MFLTRQSIEDGLAVLRAYGDLKSEEQVKLILANEVAREMFPEFQTMSAEEKADILNMLIEDMSIDYYMLN